jgi:hypothetical protein
MAKTPEGKVKDKIRIVLDRYKVYYFMPVQFGYGPSGLDYHCCIEVRGWPIAFWVEAKEEGKPTTNRQDVLINMLRTQYKASVFIVDDEYTLKGLERWLIQMQELSQSTPATQGSSTSSRTGSVTTK